MRTSSETMRGLVCGRWLVLLVVVVASSDAFAIEAPATLEALYALAPVSGVEAPAFGVEKRRAAMRLAALGFGARVGARAAKL